MRDLTVTVLERQQVRGMNTLTEERPPEGMGVKFGDAFGQGFDTDAHFTLYSLLKADGEESGAPYYRFNKSVLPEIRAHGGDIVCWGFALDYDLPGHAAWTDESIGEVFETFRKLEQSKHWLATSFAVRYTTRHGMRLVYRYDTPLTVEEHEAVVQAAVTASHQVGLPCDMACRDWTRLFRLPRVARDAPGAWEEPPYGILNHEPRTVDLSEIDAGPAAAPAAPLTIQKLDISQPTPEEADAILRLHTGKRGKPGFTEFYKEAKRRLKGRDCYPYLFEKKILEEGSRDSEITRLLGEALSMLAPISTPESRSALETVPGTSPQSLYALFYDTVSALRPDQGTRDWQASLWGKVQRIYPRHIAQVQQGALAIQQTEKAVLVEVEKTTGGILEGVKKWHIPPLPADEKEALAIIDGKLVVQYKGSYFLMQENGRYSESPRTRTEIRPALERSPLRHKFQLTDFEKPWKTSKFDDMLKERQVVADDLLMVPQAPPGGVLTQEGGATKLVLCSYRRAALPPEESPWVNEWLYHFGGPHYERLCFWIARALAFEEGPTCSFSVCGPPSIGKTMIVHGLAECLEVPKLAYGADLMEKFNANLAKTPWVSIDEGAPINHSGASKFLDAFRKVTSGASFPVRDMRTLNATVTNPIRVIFTANNLNLVRSLTRGSDTPEKEDQEALSRRLFHFNATDAAAKWLASKGGRHFTQGWVSDGKESKFVVAKHFLWLHQKFKGAPKEGEGRFLMEGRASEQILRELTEASGDLFWSIPVVEELLAEMLSHKGSSFDGSTGLFVDHTGVYVVPSLVLKTWENKGRRSKQDVSLRAVTKALSTLCDPSHGHRLGGHYQRWLPLKNKGARILEFMESMSLSTDRVREAMKEPT